ncbi:hypothetical protein TNCV_2192981 [Trichonephila clavipes]|nr:hypothetical protein TNCV_2192981 [Trichonephila clavipes]
MYASSSSVNPTPLAHADNQEISTQDRYGQGARSTPVVGFGLEHHTGKDSKISWAKFPKWMIDGDSTDFHLHNLGMELKGHIPSPLHSGFSPQNFGPTDLMNTYSVCTRRYLATTKVLRALRPGVVVWNGELVVRLDFFL